MAAVRLFASAREAAGTGRDSVDAPTVGDALDVLADRYGEAFAAVLATCRVWVNGSPAVRGDHLADRDELAVLPPVSGGGLR